MCKGINSLPIRLLTYVGDNIGCGILRCIESEFYCRVKLKKDKANSTASSSGMETKCLGILLWVSKLERAREGGVRLFVLSGFFTCTANG